MVSTHPTAQEASPVGRRDPRVARGGDDYLEGGIVGAVGAPMDVVGGAPVTAGRRRGQGGERMEDADVDDADAEDEDGGDRMDASDDGRNGDAPMRGVHPMGPESHGEAPDPPPRNRELCWLCTFCTHSKAVQLSTFISDNAHCMSNQHIAEQVKDSILSDYPNARGARKRDIVRHITFHMLEPHVRMSSVLRSLLSLAESVQLSISYRDAETGDVVLDTKQADLYLRILAQVQVAYRSGGSALLFSARSGGA